MRESNIGGTSVVGIFPHGRAACGAEELAGNVWEWCSTQYTANYTEYPSPERLQVLTDEKAGKNKAFGLRGGAFYSKQMFSSCAARDVLGLNLWLGDFGLRVARLFS
jgi:formylglycine-generating enzyme required for sulfatase activity